MSAGRYPIVPIEQQVTWYRAEYVRAQSRLQQQVNGGKMRPAMMEHLLKQMRAVLRTLEAVEEQGIVH